MLGRAEGLRLRVQPSDGVVHATDAGSERQPERRPGDRRGSVGEAKVEVRNL